MTTATRPRGRAAGLVVPAPTLAARVERVFLEREVAAGERLAVSGLAREFGTVDLPAVRGVLRRLRDLRGQDPTLGALHTRFAQIQRMTPGELAATCERARLEHAEVIEAGWWWQAAACRGMDTDLFFPPDRAHAVAARAKRVCGACPVRVECLRAELAAPVGFGPDGIVGGLAPRERTVLRPARERHGRFLDDRALTQRAHQRACQVGISLAAAEHDAHPATLKLAFDRWGLPALPARPPRYATREQARQAYQLAVRVGIMAAARQLRAGDQTLRAAFAQHGLAWPPPRPAGVRLVDPVFFALNPTLLVPHRLSPEGASARVRRQEAFEILGPRVVYALGDENHTRPGVRAWCVAQRARQARQAALAAHLAARPLLAVAPAVEPDPAHAPGTSGQRPRRTAA